MVQYGRPSCSSWKEICMGILWKDYYGKDNLRKFFWKTDGKSSKMGMSLCTSWKRIILICVCGWHKIGWKETKFWSDVETTQQRSRFGRTNIILWHCFFWSHSTRVSTSKDIVNNYRDVFESRMSAGGKENNLVRGDLMQTSQHGLMIWKVMQRSVSSDVASWRTKRFNNCTMSQLHVLTTINLKKKRWDLLENPKKYAHKLLWNACIWLELVDVLFCG